MYIYVYIYIYVYVYKKFIYQLNVEGCTDKKEIAI